MSIKGNQRTLWLFLVRLEVIDYGKTDKVEKSMLLT